MGKGHGELSLLFGDGTIYGTREEKATNVFFNFIWREQYGLLLFGITDANMIQDRP